MPHDPAPIEGSFFGEQTVDSIVDGLKEIRENLDEDEIKDLLIRLGEYKPNVGAKTAWYRRLENNDRFRELLDWIRNSRAKHAGYDVWALWGAAGARTAYNAFVQIVQMLGAFERWSSIDSSRQPLENAELVYAAWSLSCLTDASCWMLYGWDRRLNRPALLSHGGLWFPEAVEGTLWPNGFVRRSLLDDKIIEPIGAIAADEAKSSGFRQREGIRRGWRVILRAPRARAVLILNWRDDEIGPSPISEEYPGFREHALDKELLLRARRSMSLVPQETRDLNLAVRYINGWLTERDARVFGPRRIEHPQDVGTMIETVVRSFEPWLLGNKDATTVDAIDLSVLTGIKGALASIVPADDARSIEFLRCDSDRNSLAFEQAQQIDYIDRFGNAAPGRVDLSGVDKRNVLPVGSSMLAQAIAWRTSLLVRSLVGPVDTQKGRKKRRGTGREGRSLRDVRLWHRDRQSSGGSEIALPVMVFDQPIGGFSIESRVSHSLGPEQLRWMEILGFLVSGLFEVCVTPDDSGVRSEVFELLCGMNRSRTESELLTAYCQIVRRVSNADLVHVLSYDDARAQFRPGGAAASEAMLQRFRKFLGVRKAVDESIVLRLIESELRPQRRRRSWEIFRDGGEPLWVDLRNLDEAAVSRFTKRHFEIMCGVPFAISKKAAPDGALWVSYANKTDAERDLGRSTLNAIDRLSGIVASVLAAYRYANSRTR